MGSATDLLHEARAKERAACIPEAIHFYETAISSAERNGEKAVLAEALRRLAVVLHYRNESARARDLCNRSYTVATSLDNDILAAEALNTMGGLALRTGALEEARTHFLQALELGGQSPALLARVEQNLGIIANIRGQVIEAVAHYERSVEAYRAANDEHGSATTYVNLGIAHTDLRQYDWADSYFGKSFEIAERAGDIHWCGGLTEMRRIGALAAAYDIPVIPPGGGSRDSVHWIAATPNSPWAELFMPAPGGPKAVYQQYEEDNQLTRGPEGIYTRPSDKPGFGWDLVVS